MNKNPNRAGGKDSPGILTPQPQSPTPAASAPDQEAILDHLEELLLSVAGFIDLAQIRLQTLFWNEPDTQADLASDGIVRSARARMHSIQAVIKRIHHCRATDPASASVPGIGSPDFASIREDADALLPSLAGFVKLLKSRLQSLLRKEEQQISRISAEGVAGTADLVLTDIELTVNRLRLDYGTSPTPAPAAVAPGEEAGNQVRELLNSDFPATGHVSPVVLADYAKDHNEASVRQTKALLAMLQYIIETTGGELDDLAAGIHEMVRDLGRRLDRESVLVWQMAHCIKHPCEVVSLERRAVA